MSSTREIDIKNRTYYLFDDININFDPKFWYQDRRKIIQKIFSFTMVK